MKPRVQEELALLQAWFGDRLTYLEEGQWILVTDYRIPVELWKPSVIEVAFQIPIEIPGQAPYSFHVRPEVCLLNGEKPASYTHPTSNPFGDGFGTFSWQVEEWNPSARACDGSNMLDFARSISERFRQGA